MIALATRAAADRGGLGCRVRFIGIPGPGRWRKQLFALALLLVAGAVAAGDDDADDVIDLIRGLGLGAKTAMVAPGGAELHSPSDLVIDRFGTLWVTDFGRHTVLKLTPAGELSVLAGNPEVDVNVVGGSRDGVGPEATFMTPMGIEVDAAGNLYVANLDDKNIRKVTPEGAVSTFAGLVPVPGEAPTSQHRDGPSGRAEFSHPQGIAIDGAGNFYIADAWNNNIRKITPAGLVSTLAGCVKPGGCPSGSRDGAAARAEFNAPQAVAVDGEGNVYVADTGNHAIRKIAAGVVSTLAGQPGVRGYADGQGAAARFYGPQGIAVDVAGQVYVADTDNALIRKISPGGRVTRLAGSPYEQNEGDLFYADGAGPAARFSQPLGLTVDLAGNVYVADAGNHAIRKITPKGLVSTIAKSQPLLD